MSRETEKVFKEFNEFIKGKDIKEEDMEMVLNEFMNKKSTDFENSWDYLDMAMNADNRKDALKYAKKALAEDKNCLDAEIMIAELTSDDPEKLKSKYEVLINKTEKTLKEEGLFDEDNMGSFWGILDTRPYMRLRYSYLELLITMGKLSKSISECEKLLTLSENDNLGVRYKLLSLYALFEDEASALKLYERYDEDSAGMLLPIIAMYYKMDNYSEAKKYIKRLNKVNKKVLDFINYVGEHDGEEMQEFIESGMYTLGSKEEILATVTENIILYNTTSTFFIWLENTYRKR